MKPLISVIMPAYNGEKYLAEAIESILDQTYNNFEFIIINDGSTDKSLEIIKEYAKKDKRIKIINNNKNLGISLSLNKGVITGKGKYIAIMNQDDISLTKRFEEQIKFLEENPEVDIVGAAMETFDEEGDTFLRRYPLTNIKIRKKIWFYSPLAHPSIMVRKEVFKKVGLYRNWTFPCEDLEFFFRAGEKYKLANLPSVLLKHRYHKDSITMSNTKLMEKKANQIRWKYSKSPAYNFGMKEFLYNFLHLISICTIPTKFKSWLYFKLVQKRVK